MSINEKEQLIQKLWFNYYNEYLFKKGVLTQEQKEKIEQKICKIGFVNK